MTAMCSVTVEGGVLPPEEINGYVARAGEKFGVEPESIRITVDGDEVELDYELPGTPFVRLRRVTGYLAGSLERFNDAKRAEERDRVKHGVA